MATHSIRITPEQFLNTLDYVIHHPEIEFARFHLLDHKPVGLLARDPSYTLCGWEQCANVSDMFEAAKSGREITDFWSKHFLEESKGWTRQELPYESMDVLQSVVEQEIVLRRLERKYFEPLFIGSLRSYDGFENDPFLQQARKHEDDPMGQKILATLKQLRAAELDLAMKYGFDLDKYSTLDFGKHGDSTPYKMDHVMEEAKIHAVEYYFNPTPMNTMVFNALKALHSEEVKDFVDAVKTYNSIIFRKT